MTPNQPPSGLPPFPPVPEGYDRWEYRGLAWNPGKVCNYAFHDGKEHSWTRFGWCRPSASDGHYIEAVKDGAVEEAHQEVEKQTHDVARKLLQEAFDAGKPAKRWVYHYAAEINTKPAGWVPKCWRKVDGILDFSGAINSHKEYEWAKVNILEAEEMQGSEIQITSLSLLHGV